MHFKTFERLSRHLIGLATTFLLNSISNMTKFCPTVSNGHSQYILPLVGNRKAGTHFFNIKLLLVSATKGRNAKMAEMAK